MGGKLRMVSWMLLTLVGGLTLLGAGASMSVAYFTDDDQIGPITLAELTENRDDVATAIKARRATAAAFGAGYAILFLAIVLGPYRRGEVWAWWAILAVTLVVNGIILLRIVVLGTNLGLGAATIPLSVCVIALLLDVSRLKET